MGYGRVLVVGALLAGAFGAGRFVSSDPPVDTGVPAVAAAPRSTTDRLAELEARVARDPDDVSGWQALGVTYVRRAYESADPSFYDLSARALDRADELLPGHVGTVLGRGVLALSLHRFDEALELGRRASALNPSSSAALGVQVDALVELGRYEESAAVLQQMLDRRPDLAALSRASYQRQLLGDLPGAVQAMQQALTASAGSAYDVASVTTLLGDLDLVAGDVDAARERYDEALAAAPSLVTATVGRARVLAAAGDEQAAIAELQVLVDRVPVLDALVLLGLLQARQGDAAAAGRTHELVRATAALQEASGQVVDLEMALFEANVGDPDRAVVLARQVVAERPASIFANDALAWALLRSGDAAGAVGPMEQALRLGTPDAAVRYHAAEVFAAVGDLDRARLELRRAMDATAWSAFFYREPATALATRLGMVASS